MLLLFQRLLNIGLNIGLDRVIRSHYEGVGLLCLLYLALRAKTVIPAWFYVGTAVILYLVMLR